MVELVFDVVLGLALGVEWIGEMGDWGGGKGGCWGLLRLLAGHRLGGVALELMVMIPRWVKKSREFICYHNNLIARAGGRRAVSQLGKNEALFI